MTCFMQSGVNYTSLCRHSNHTKSYFQVLIFAQRMNEANNSKTSVICISFLHHVQNKKKVLKRISIGNQ